MITAGLQIYTILITIGIHSCERNFYPVSRNVIKSSIAIGEGKSDDYTDVDFHKLFFEEGRKLCDKFSPSSAHKNARGVQQIRRPWKVKRSSDLEYYYKRPHTPRKRVHTRMLEQQGNNEDRGKVADYNGKEETEYPAKTVKRVAKNKGEEANNREEVEELHGKDEEDDDVEGEEGDDEDRSKEGRLRGFPFHSQSKLKCNDETEGISRHRQNQKKQRGGHRCEETARGKDIYKPRRPHICEDAAHKPPKYTKPAKSLEEITDEQASNIRRLIQALLIWGLGGLVAMVLFLCCCYAAYLVCIERQVQPSSEISGYSTYESESDK